MPADMKQQYIGALDQGTTSTRFILFTRGGEEVGSHQVEHTQYYPQPGWVEHDPREIWERTCEVITRTLSSTGVSPEHISAVGITNQRETTLVWNPDTGEVYGNALVWQDTRTSGIIERLSRQGGADRFRETTGLPLSTYFSGSKLEWLLENASSVREAAGRGEAVVGTIDTWLVWNLTGGPGRGVHITDVTNASRTMLMDLDTLDWDEEMLQVFGVPREMLPEIRPSVPGTPYGYTVEEGPFGCEIPVAGVLGDQQAALFGQACFDPGSSKNTYGTGCFLLLNTGEKPVHSRYGLLTTVGYQLGSQAVMYAMEGSIAIAGALVQWIRDNFGLIEESAQIEELARSVDDSGGVYFVPAFSGLFAPYWRGDARGVIVGLSSYVHKGHIARAVLEATAFQTLEIFDAMRKDSGIEIESLRADGGMVVNELLMQFQADILEVPVIRPSIKETTALGAAFAAGLSVGFWDGLDEIKALWQEEKRWVPQMNKGERDRRYRFWKKAVTRSFDWIEEEA
jgi:glycerol kinase